MLGAAGDERVQLHIESYRLPAIKTYLRLGFCPVVASAPARRLWEKVGGQLGWTFAPEVWQASVPWE